MFIINGIQVAEPRKDGVTVADEPLWSSKTGRTNDSTAKMHGKIITWKKTVKVSWAYLTFAEFEQIRQAVKSGGSFFDIQFTDTNTDNLTTLNVYADHVEGTQASLVWTRFHDVTIQFTER